MDRSSSSGPLEYAIKKYGEDAVLASSADLSWSGVAAELRVYERGERGHERASGSRDSRPDRPRQFLGHGVQRSHR